MDNSNINDGSGLIPNYALYGERNTELFPDILHCESIAARSRQHDWKIGAHRHHQLHQFFLLETGGGTISVEGERYELGTPVAISMPPLTVHGFRFQQETKGWVITVPSMILKEALLTAPDIRERLSKPAFLKSPGTIAACFRRMVEEHRGTGPGRQQYLVHLAGILALEFARDLMALDRLPHSRESRQHGHVRKFLSLLEENFATCHAARDYAGQLNMTAPHLNRICRDVTGKTTSRLIQDRLVLEAKRSLVYTKMSIAELAYAIGFSDPAHFSRFFQQRTGMAPSAFRQKMDRIT
ncbi:helix-turn-helix domain-containing protein [Sneathiella chinensis]|uniref:helix-turn-helix domain-containing protein n=1 Tax=Sneathiella chinensis TaxID=349750 RepID=UPI00146F25E2|nr:helix-turn-helix domain-containing protein [Sneathiella chinensis]